MRPLRLPVVTTQKWWISSLTAAVLGSLVLTVPAGAGRKKRPPEPDPVTAPVPAPKAPKTKPIPLFPDALPIDPGPIPKGLANLTAQGCAGCHFDSHAGWADSRHAIGWRDPVLTTAWDSAGTPACQSCHLPLIAQQPHLVAHEEGDVNAHTKGDNPAFNASLRIEGVTCAACHVREGKIVAARPPEDVGKAPHPMAWSEDLAESSGCASCHQLQWPGSNAPFYDTFGEWKSSAYAKAGVSCVDCHGGPGAGGRTAGLDHAMPRGESRAVSLLLDMPGLEIVRGGDPVPLSITIQNTGAGHSFPTGSPFVGVQLQAWLEGPPDKKGVPTRSDAFTHDFARTLGDAPPWNITADTRLASGATKTLETPLALDVNAPEGTWSLKVQLVRTVRGEPTEHVVIERDLPLSVQ